MPDSYALFRAACVAAFAAALVITAALALTATAARATTPADEKAQTVVHLLDYVSVDYPEFVRDGKVLDAAEYEEQKEFVTQAIALLEQLPGSPDAPKLLDGRGDSSRRSTRRLPATRSRRSPMACVPTSFAPTG